MKKFAVLALAAVTLASAPIVPGFSVGEAEAGNPTPGQLRGEGRRECQAIPTGWIGTVRADQYGDYHSGDRFSVKYCFRTSAECANFVNNIERIVYPVNEVFYRNCRPY